MRLAARREATQGIVEGLATCLPGLVTSAYAKRAAARADGKAGATARGTLERTIQKQLTPGDDRALTAEETIELRAFAIASLQVTAVGRTEVKQALKLAATYQDGKTPTAPSTFKRKRAALSKFFSYAVDASLIDISPLSRLRREVAHKVEDTVVVIDRAEVGTVAECAALIGCVRSSYHRLFLWVIFMAGLRPSEVCGLRVGDITFTAGEVRGYLTLRRASTEGKARYSKAGKDREVRGLKARKKGVTRDVPLSPQLEALLAAACAGKAKDAPVVTSRVGTQVTVSNLDRSFKRARGLWAESQPVMPSAVQLHVPYSLRHAAATLWLQKMPVEDVAARLGNSPDIVMKTYANVLPSKKEHYSAQVDAAYADLPELV